MELKKVFEPVRLKNLSMKNRLVRSATWEDLARPDGGITEESCAIYEELAKGGVGAIITGFTSVASNDFYFGGMMRLSDDDLIPQYRRLTDIIHQEGCPVIVQLALGAYYRPEGNEQVEPDRMTADEGIDSIEVSGNGTSVGGIRPHVNEAYFAAFAARF